MSQTSSEIFQTIHMNRIWSIPTFALLPGSSKLDLNSLVCSLTKLIIFAGQMLAETKMLHHKKDQKVTCNMLQLTFICVSNFGFILLPTGSPLTKLGQF